MPLDLVAERGFTFFTGSAYALVEPLPLLDQSLGFAGAEEVYLPKHHGKTMPR